MIEELIQNSVLLSEEGKKIVLEKAKTGTVEYRKKLEKLLREEDDFIILLFRKYQEETGEDAVALIKGISSTVRMQQIREQEKKEEENTIISLSF